MLHLIQINNIPLHHVKHIGDWCNDNISGWAFGRDISTPPDDLYTFTYNDRTWKLSRASYTFNKNDQINLSALILDEEDALAFKLKWI